jgi:hypothetical protein
MIAPPGPVVDADDRGRRKGARSAPPHQAQKGVIAHLNVEAARKGSSRPTSERDGETVRDLVETACSPCSWLDRLEPLGEDPSGTGLGVAEEAARPQYQRYPDARRRKIRQPSPILAMNATTSLATRRTSAIDRDPPHNHDEAAVVLRRTLNDKPARNQL